MRFQSFRAMAQGAMADAMAGAVEKGAFGPGLDLTHTDTTAGAASSPLVQTQPTGANPGALEMFSYIPPGLPARAPLVVILHGCGQTAAGYDGGTGWSLLGAALGFAVLAPQQVAANNPNTCFNWFEPGDAARDHGEAASIRAMIEQMVHDHDLDTARIFITGLSAGGAMTAAMLAAYPDMFAGGAILAGLPAGAASTMPQAFQAMRQAPGHTPRQWGDLVRAASSHHGPRHQHWPRVSIWQGDADTVVAPGNGAALAQQWADVHGLAGSAPKSTKGANFSRRAWIGENGRASVELIDVAGMGHGVPIGADAYGRQGPYFLDVGLSSTAAIARFWGFKVPATVAGAARKPGADAMRGGMAAMIGRFLRPAPG